MNPLSNLLSRGLLAMLLGLSALTAEADTDRKVVDGMIVYLGLMPAEVVLGHPKRFPEKGMHCVPKGKNRYHVVIDLVDETSGKRIEGALVIATVSDVGSTGERKALEPMRIHNSRTYGNWFILSSRSPYRVHLEISDIRGKSRIETDLEYKP